MRIAIPSPVMPQTPLLVLGYISPARPVGTQVTSHTSQTEGTALVRITSHSLGFVPVPDVIHTVCFDSVVYTAYRFVIRNPFTFHGDISLRLFSSFGRFILVFVIKDRIF
jgi:hypothetical protein